LRGTAMTRMFGDPVMGVWFCPRYLCEFSVLPDQLEKEQDSFEWGSGAESLRYMTNSDRAVGPKCPTCGTSLEYEEYDEAA